MNEDKNSNSNNDNATATATATAAAVLVVGATGATGKHVVHQLLQQGRPVHVIVRSQERFMQILNEIDSTVLVKTGHLLKVTEASLLDMSDLDLQQHVTAVDSVVCCLGHTMTLSGIWGKPYNLCTDATRRLIQAMILQSTTKSNNNRTKPQQFVLMNTEGVAHPAGTDRRRSCVERVLFTMIRTLVPPQSDNEAAASVLYHEIGRNAVVEWVAVRPTHLIDGSAVTWTPPSTATSTSSLSYQIFDQPYSLFATDATVARSHVAQFMVDLISNHDLWQQYKYDFPLIQDRSVTSILPTPSEDDKPKSD